ncbi:MAG: hypothetical protein V3W04_07190 [Gammaproteobacteria bacterium]
MSDQQTIDTGQEKSLILRVILSFILVATAAVALLGPLDEMGEQYTNDSFKRALLTFGIARGLNGVISVVQGTEVAVEPAGVGVIFTPGQILDPVNDLIERFSWVMLVSSTSLGIQSMLLKVFSSSSLSFALAAVLLLVLLAVWWRRSQSSVVWRQWLYRIAAVLVLLRFLIPLMALTNAALYHYFLEDEYKTASAELEKTTQRIGNLNAQSKQPEKKTALSPWFESFNKAYKSTTEMLNVQKRVETIKKLASTTTEHTIHLMVVFIVQTVLLPLLFLWLSMRLVAMALRFRPD